MIKKNLFTFCLSLAFVCLGLVSCSKDSEKSNPVVTPVVTPDVEEAISNKVTCTLSGDITGAFTSQMVINSSLEKLATWTAANTTGNALSISIYDLASTPKSYSLSTDAYKSANVSFINASTAKTYVLSSGTLNVTAVTDKSVKGTFSGEGTSPDGYLKITNGAFELKR